MNRKIVSTDAVATEIVAALGVSERLVAISHDSDMPTAVLTRPRVTRVAAGADGPVEIDDTVWRAAGPDLVVARAGQGHVQADGLKSMLLAAGAGSPDIVVIDGTTLDGILGDVERVGEALELGLVGLSIAGGLRARIDAVREAVAQAPRRSVAFIGAVASAPWLEDLVTAAGGKLVTLASVSSPVDLVVACAPEHGAELPWPDSATERAVIIDSARFMRPGPRVAEAVEVLAALLHPNHVPRLVARWSDAAFPVR